MAGNTLGKTFCVTNWGESHGAAIGATVDGCPSGVELSVGDIQADLDRRRPGQSDIVTPRDEADKVEILSGVFEGKTTGAPIQLMIKNRDQRSKDYSEIRNKLRPSHADYTYRAKYVAMDPNGGGRSSARVTAGTVAAGAIAKKLLGNVKLKAYVIKIHTIEARLPKNFSVKDIEDSKIRCPDQKASLKMEEVIKKALEAGDSVGGVIELVITGVDPGLGEPVYSKLDADLAHAMMNINAVKGVEVGSGFRGSEMFGSEHNDPFSVRNGKVHTTKNDSGGIQGGISNGEDIVLRVAFKPTSTIRKPQKTVSSKGEATVLSSTGRHDPCVVPRAVPIVEASAALILADHLLRQKAIG